MAYLSKSTSLDTDHKDLKRDKPLKLPPIDKNQILKRFERTLVGRPLLREVQEQKLPAMIGFLPTIWRCEGRVQGFEMGQGRVHFRFQNEEDLLLVMENRPYHYDGSMIALERWVPTVRRDFPNTIPFWIVIQGLPDYRREEETVRSIGEDLGEYMKVDVSDPIPKVRVTLDCSLPLVKRRETDDLGALCVLDFLYEKLHKHCSRCLRMTHEAPSCPDRPREHQQPRDNRREALRRRDEKEVRSRSRVSREGRERAVDPPRNYNPRRDQATSMMASSSKPRPVRRDLFAELEGSDAKPVPEKLSTKAWVSKTFGQTARTEEAPRRRQSASFPDSQQESSLARDNPPRRERAPWYRDSVEEAAEANAEWDAVVLPRSPARSQTVMKQNRDDPTDLSVGAIRVANEREEGEVDLGQLISEAHQ
ncbi:hypothetical protein AALP_AA6G132600, partial [Arabis alpina]